MDWLPPDDNKPYASYFERKGKLFATLLADDTVLQMDVGKTDNGSPFGCVMAHGLYDSGDTAEWKTVSLTGSTTQDTIITVEPILDSSTSVEKEIDAEDFSFAGGRSFSDVAVGDLVVGGSTSDEPIADFVGKTFAIAPVTFGQLYQTVLSSSGRFTFKGYQITLNSLSSPSNTIE